LSKFRDNILNLCSRKQSGDSVACVNDLLSNASINEHELAWVFGLYFENNVDDVIALAPNYISRFPDSLYPVRVFFADLLSRRELFDEASHEARSYLRSARDSGLFVGDISQSPIFCDGIARAFLLLTSVYTEVGALSYSLRVINIAKKINFTQRWENIFNSECMRINDSLNCKLTSETNRRWEMFFETGEYINDLSRSCMDKGFLMLRNRLNLIADKFRFSSDWEIDQEVFEIIFQDSAGSIFLK
jgi:hypothetical protein